MNPQVDEEKVPLAEPKGAQTPEPDIEVELVDDTPEPDKGRKPPQQPVERIAEETDAADAGFAPDAQKRIQKLKYVYHEERRNKEKAERELQEAISYAQRALEENNRLKHQLSNGERVLIDVENRRAAAQVDAAKHLLRQAQESADTEQIIKAQEIFSRAVAEHDRVKQWSPQLPSAPPPQQQVPQAQFQSPAQQPRQADPRTSDWMRKNPWYQSPGYEEMTGVAQAISDALRARGVLPGGETADQYWSTIDERLRASYPAFFGSGGAGNGNGQPGAATQPNGRTGARTANNPKPVVVSAGNRAPGGPVRVTLTQSMADIARKLGLTNEQYARQLLKERQQQS